MILRKTIFILLFGVVFSPSIIHAQKTENKVESGSNVRVGFFVYPYAFYTPEKRFAFGGGGVLSFRDTTIEKAKPSQILFSAYYTTVNQFLVYVSPQVYLKNDGYLLTGVFWIERLIEKFYGYGSDTPEIDNPFYKLFDFTADIGADYAFTRSLLAGVRYYYEYTTAIDIMENRLLENGDYLGRTGGINSGLGIRLLYDTRNNLFYPSSGFYNEFSALFFSKRFGSDFKFDEYFFDIRKYFALSENQILALEIYYNSVTGNAPFYAYPKLGGDKKMRGYYEGRYRGKNYLTAQAEMRTLVWHKFYGVVFLGLGDVFNNKSELQVKRLKFSYGFGLRYRLDEKEKINIRLDIGFGKNTNGLYFQVEEAF